jgi:Holliday junction resolvase RusA-like endonuclease
MTTDTYTGPLWVPGHPVSKGSMTCVAKHAPGHHARLVPEKTKRDPDGFVGKLPDVLAWKAQAVAANPINDPVELRVDFYMAKPGKTDFTAPVGHNIGDLDKLIRTVGDAVGGSKTNPSRLVVDDARIARIVAEKIYATDNDQEGAMIELRPYTPPAARTGEMQVRITAGRVDAMVGTIRSPQDLPRLLRAVADQMERNGTGSDTERAA